MPKGRPGQRAGNNARPLTGARGSITRPSLPRGELRRTSVVNKTLAKAIWEVNPHHLFQEKPPVPFFVLSIPKCHSVLTEQPLLMH